MKNSNNATVVAQVSTPVISELEQLKLDKEMLNAKIAELKAAEKVAKVKKANKGVPVQFTNQKGELLTGLGVLYYVTRIDKKLHYKEASQVTLL